MTDQIPLFVEDYNEAVRATVPAQLAYIRRRARQEGVHILAAFEMRDAGYADPMPITPEDEAAQLQREFVMASKHLTGLFSRMERAGLKVVA